MSNTKFYIGTLTPNPLPNIETNTIKSFSYQNSSNESFIFQPSIKIKEQYSCIKFDGGKQDPYPETVFNTTNNNQIEPNPRQKTQIEQTEKYYYIIHKNYILFQHNSLPALKSFYEKFFSLPNLDIAHTITNITDYLAKLSKVSSIQVSIPQQSQDDFFDKNLTSNIPQDLGCASDTKIDLKITPTNIKDLNKFKETIKDYDAKYYNLKINGQNESGYLYNYKQSCIKEIISINTDETDDIIFESLITNLEKWMQNNND